MAESLHPSQGMNQTKPTEKEPILVQLDPQCLHSALKEFFEPLRTNDSRADFFAVYRKEAAEFDRDYAKKYDEDLNTTLIFAGLFSAVSSAFIIDVQSKLEPDPNEMTAAYMKILIHAVNASLFPDADPGAIAWTGPPPGVITVQALLYASLATSLFAAFVAVLGKQWVNRYIRNHGGSAVDKCHDRQRKVDGFKKWHFHLVVESLPVMLQLAVLLLGCALSRYLWTISRTVSGIILAITLFGVTIYVFLTLAATIYYNCPYQTPPSITTRSIIKYLSHSDNTFTRSLRSFIAPFSSVINLSKFPKQLRFGIRHVARVFGCTPAVTKETENTPLVTVAASPTRVFEDIIVNWEACRADVRCIWWVFDSTTDIDVIFSTARFAADTIWYPEIVGAVSPLTLADLFFDCLLDGEIIPGKLEHAISIGMALASVLSVKLNMEPENETLKQLRWGLLGLRPNHLPTERKSTSSLVMEVLRSVALSRCSPAGSTLYWSVPDQLSTTHKLWLSRVVLQTLWQSPRVQKPINGPRIYRIDSLFEKLMGDDGRRIGMLRTNCFLIAAISLGLQIDLRDLYAPDNIDALKASVRLFDQQFRVTVREGSVRPNHLCPLLLAVTHLDPFEATDSGEMGFFWISEILNSKYPVEEQYSMASDVVRRVERYRSLRKFPPDIQSVSIPPLLKFLSLCENFPTTESPPDPRLVALRILSDGQQDADFGAALIPTLAPMLSSDHPLRSRRSALTLFNRFMAGWFSSQMKAVSARRLDNLLQAVGDPFYFLPEPPQDRDGGHGRAVRYDPMEAVVVLIEFASSNLWQNHLRPSNFASCEDTLSADQGRKSALRAMFFTALTGLPEFLSTPTKIVAAIGRLEKLGCLNTARVVIMWGWVTCMADTVDQDGRRLIGDETLRFYRTHGMRSLAALKQCIIRRPDEGTKPRRPLFFAARYEGAPFRVGRSRRPSQLSFRTRVIPPLKDEWYIDHFISQACQLRMLYQLFGCDPTTWQEAVGVEQADEEREVCLRRSVAPDLPIDWECDYL